MADTTPGTAPVTDHCVAPRGVLPRHTQMWLMIAVAVGILGIVAVTGHSEPTPRATTTSVATNGAPSAEHLRDFSDRLRVANERARELMEASTTTQSPPSSQARPFDERMTTPAGQDPIDAERKRREYDSLFASNVVLSRRPDGQRLTAGQPETSRARAAGSADGSLPPPPTIDEVAEAVVRATQGTPSASAPHTQPPTDTRVAFSPPPTQIRPQATGAINATGPMHPVLEGTLIDAVLTNRLDGAVAAPVNCLVTNPVYSHDGRYVLIPAGARVLGETKPVQAFGDTRLAVSFNRLLMPDGRTYRLDQFVGLNDIGDAGLRDQVNQHYKSTFGASAAVGLISGFAQYLGTGGFNRGSGTRTVVITGGVSDAAAQSTAQVMNRFLNRPPHITIREGHRVKVYVTNDFDLPPYGGPATPGGSLAAETR